MASRWALMLLYRLEAWAAQEEKATASGISRHSWKKTPLGTELIYAHAVAVTICMSLFSGVTQIVAPRPSVHLSVRLSVTRKSPVARRVSRWHY